MRVALALAMAFGVATAQESSPAVSLGARFEPVPGGPGLVVADIAPGGPAAAANLQVGDTVLSYVSVTGVIWRTLTADSVESWLASAKPGQRYFLSVKRGDKTVGALIVLSAPGAAPAPLPDTSVAAAATPPPPDANVAVAVAAPPPPPAPAQRAPPPAPRVAPAAPQVAIALASGSPQHAFCGGFDPGFRVFYVSSPTETVQPEATLEQRWGARLRARHELAKPAGVFCLVAPDAALVASRRSAMAAKVKADGLLVVEDDL